MITYMEKGAGLHRAVTDAGHWLEQRDGVWISSDDDAVQRIIDGYTLEQARAEQQRRVAAQARELYDAVTAGISAAEMAGWPILLAESAAYRASGEVGTAIQAEAAIRGIPVETLVAKIEGNAAAFKAARAAIAGTDGRKRDEIDGLTTFAAVAAYDISAGWPL